MQILGIDIGGSSIKGAIVDTVTGKLVTEHYRFQSPKPATPEAVAAALAQLIIHFNWSGPVGVLRFSSRYRTRYRSN